MQANVSELKEGETKFKKQLQDSETQDAEKTKQYHECIAKNYAVVSQLKNKIVGLTDSLSQLNEKQGEVNNDMTNKDKEILILKEDIANIMNEKLEVDEQLATSETKLVYITQELEKTKNDMLLSHRKSSELETCLLYTSRCV